VRLKLGKQAYCVIELTRGEDVADVARKLRELAAQVEAPASGRVPARGGSERQGRMMWIEDEAPLLRPSAGRHVPHHEIPDKLIKLTKLRGEVRPRRKLAAVKQLAPGFV
jgi:hypothetical protein